MEKELLKHIIKPFRDKKMIDIDFCKRLVNLRTEKGMTQAQLEKAAGLPAMVLSHYENGTRKPGLDNIKSLCRGLGCNASDLIVIK